MDSEMIDSRKRTQNGLRNEQLLLFLAQIVDSCSENRAREGGCQGASWPANSSLLESGGAPFFEPISGTNNR